MPNFANVMPGYHMGDAVPNENKKKTQMVKPFGKIDVWFLVVVIGSYMISW